MDDQTAGQVKERRRPGRKPMTAEEKAQAAEARALKKAKAENLQPKFIVQYQGIETDSSTMVDAAIADIRSTKKRVRISDLVFYIKPEEKKVYYVANGKYEGSIPL